MRSVVVGLALAVGLVAGAQAKDCPLEKAVLVASEGASPMGLAHPELIGQSFTVGRVARSFKLQPDPRSEGRRVSFGDVQAELNGAAGSYVVTQSYAPGSSPFVSATSWDAVDAKPLNWSAKSKAPYPMPLASGQPYLEVLSGPLAGLSFNLGSCRP